MTIWLICRWLIHLDSLSIYETWLTPNIIHPLCRAELHQLSSIRWSNSLALLWPCHKKQEHMRNAGRKRPVISELEGGTRAWTGLACFPNAPGKSPMATQCFSTQTGWRGSLYRRRERCLADVCWRSTEHLSLSQRSQTSHSLLATSVTCVYQKKVYQVLF